MIALVLAAAVSLPPIMSDARYETPGVTPELVVRLPKYAPKLPPKPVFKCPHHGSCKRRATKETSCEFKHKRAMRNWRGDCVKIERDYEEAWHSQAAIALAKGFNQWVEDYRRNR